MRKIGLAVIAAGSLAAAGCASYPDQYGYGYGPGYYNNGYYNNGYNNGYTYDSQGRRITKPVQRVQNRDWVASGRRDQCR